MIQGTAADIIKLAMINLQRECASSLDDPAATRVHLQIHDELLLECPNDAPTIKSCVLVTLHCLEGGAALSLWRVCVRRSCCTCASVVAIATRVMETVVPRALVDLCAEAGRKEAPLRVPLAVKACVGPSWGDREPYELR